MCDWSFERHLNQFRDVILQHSSHPHIIVCGVMCVKKREKQFRGAK